MLTLTSKILVKYQKLLVNANPVWTNNYVKRPNKYTGASTNRRSHTGASSVWSYSDMYQHSAYLRPHKPSLCENPDYLIAGVFSATCTQDTRHKTQALFWQFCITGGSCHKSFLLWQKFCRDNDKRRVLLQQNFCCNKNYTCRSSYQIVLWYLMVCVCVCVERDYWERKMGGGGGVGAHPPTYSHTTTSFWMNSLEANYYNKNRQHILLIVWLTVLQKANIYMSNTHLPSSDICARTHTHAHTHTHPHTHACMHTHVHAHTHACTLQPVCMYDHCGNGLLFTIKADGTVSIPDDLCVEVVSESQNWLNVDFACVLPTKKGRETAM